MEVELAMRADDRKEREKSDAKNSLEEYIYGVRDKVQGGPLEEFIEEAAREAFCSKLSELENWLYEDGEDEEKSVYAAKLKEIKDVGDAADMRAKEAETRPKAIEEFQTSLLRCRKFINEREAGSEKYVDPSHSLFSNLQCLLHHGEPTMRTCKVVWRLTCA
jgi:hypothetical protein